MEDAAAFSKHNKNTIRDAEDLLVKYKHFFKWLDEPEDVLEVGCANGSITSEVVFPFVEEHLNELIGSDIDEKAIDVANELHIKPKLSFSPIDIAEEDIWRKYQNKFGHIISFYTLHLVANPERWSENLFKMLKPNGQCFIVMVMPPHPFPLSLKAQKEDKSTPWAKHIENCSNLFVDFGENPVENVKGIFENSGFVVDVAEVNQLKSVYPTFEGLSATSLAVNNFQKHVPEELLPAYIEDFLKKIRDNVQQGEDGSYYYLKNVLIIIVTKPQ